MNMNAEGKAKRAPNFSPTDCLLLVDIMGKDSPEPQISNHAYLRHKFNSKITAASKKELLKTIEKEFCTSAEYPRDATELQKKWDNLVQKHRGLFADYQHSLLATGGGPCNASISALTDAVMGVVGKNVLNVTGISTPALLDTTWIQLNPDTSHTTQDMDTSLELNRPLSPIRSCSAPMASSSGTNVNRCCSCGEFDLELHQLKKRKLELEIKLLEKRLKNES